MSNNLLSMHLDADIVNGTGGKTLGAEFHETFEVLHKLEQQIETLRVEAAQAFDSARDRVHYATACYLEARRRLTSPAIPDINPIELLSSVILRLDHSAGVIRQALHQLKKYGKRVDKAVEAVEVSYRFSGRDVIASTIRRHVGDGEDTIDGISFESFETYQEEWAGVVKTINEQS